MSKRVLALIGLVPPASVAVAATLGGGETLAGHKMCRLSRNVASLRRLPQRLVVLGRGLRAVHTARLWP